MIVKEIFSPEAAAAALLKEDKFPLRELSKRTGISKSRLGRMRNKSGSLTISEAASLSAAFDLPASVFLPSDQSLTLTDQQSVAANTLGAAMSSAINQQIAALGPNLSTDAVESWYFNTQGKLVEMPEITPYLSLMRAPKRGNDLPKAVSIGPRSLTAEKLGTDPRQVDDYIGYLSEASRETLDSYQIVADLNQMQAFYRTVVFPEDETPLLMLYKTVLMPVVEHGEMLIWNFSKKVSARLVSESELEGRSIPLGD